MCACVCVCVCIKKTKLTSPWRTSQNNRVGWWRSTLLGGVALSHWAGRERQRRQQNHHETQTKTASGPMAQTPWLLLCTTHAATHTADVNFHKHTRWQRQTIFSALSYRKSNFWTSTTFANVIVGKSWGIMRWNKDEIMAVTGASNLTGETFDVHASSLKHRCTICCSVDMLYPPQCTITGHSVI